MSLAWRTPRAVETRLLFFLLLRLVALVSLCVEVWLLWLEHWQVKGGSG
jgi:hypothetical protein